MIDEKHEFHQYGTDRDDYFSDEDAERYFANLSDNTDELNEAEEKPTDHDPFAIVMVICIMIVFLGIAVNVLIVERFNNHHTVHPAAAKSTERSAEDASDTISKLSRPSVVLITADNTTQNGNVETIQRSFGSGVIISEDGTIVTCEHVIAGAGSVSVRTIDNQVYWANVIGTDYDHDIAVIKINASGLITATTGKAGYSLIGQKIYAIGNPGGSLSDTTAEGILYAPSQNANVEGRRLKLMLSTAQVAPGCSGGGLFTSDGKLVGMIDAAASFNDMDGSQFCCSIPIDQVMKVVNTILKNE